MVSQEHHNLNCGKQYWIGFTQANPKYILLKAVLTVEFIVVSIDCLDTQESSKLDEHGGLCGKATAQRALVWHSPIVTVPTLQLIGEDRIWARSWMCDCLVTWFCCQKTAKPGNKTAAPSWTDRYGVSFVSSLLTLSLLCCLHYHVILDHDLLRVHYNVNCDMFCFEQWQMEWP